MLDGDVYYMVRNPLHRNCVWKLYELFSALLDKEQWTITREDDVEMGDDWVPSPDVAVLRGNFDLLKDDLLKGTDVALLVEVSHKTYARDRGWKLPRYAHNKIPVYWIMSIERRTVEVFTDLSAKGTWRPTPARRSPFTKARPCRWSWTVPWWATWTSRRSSDDQTCVHRETLTHLLAIESRRQ